MSERLAFITACLDRTERIVDLCDRFGISEKTGHKWLQRFKTGGPASLTDRAHVPHAPRHGLAPDVAARILALRRRYPLYGPLKLRDWLTQHEPAVRWPAVSSIWELLSRAHLIRRRRHRDRTRERAALDPARTAGRS